ncbi:MAG: hypothetical protein ACRDTJ_04345 [Pseudonocardiaceae bacterium]
MAQFDALPPDERELWIERRHREQTTCSECGRPASECSDPERSHYPFRRVCYVTMERRAAETLYAELHEKEPYHNGTFASWSKDRGPSHPYHFNDGVSVGVTDRDVTPWDTFTTQRNASPTPPTEDDGEDQVLES